MRRNTYRREITAFRTEKDAQGNASSLYRLDDPKHQKLTRRKIRRKTKEKLYLALTNAAIYDTMVSIKRREINYYGKKSCVQL